MKLTTRMAHSSNPDPKLAAEEIAENVHQYGAACVLFYCSPTYDLPRLAAALQGAFGDTQVIGATSAGQIGPDGLCSGGISAISLRSRAVSVRTYLEPIGADPTAAGQHLGDRVREEFRSDGRAFGLLLVDGLSRAEERLTASLYRSLGVLPIIGGSAADNLTFTDTQVYHRGAFYRNAAVFGLFETWLPFQTFQMHHFKPAGPLCAVTAADPHRRLLYEIDGLPALEAYSEILCLRPDQIDARVFAENPLMLKVGGNFYVRSIARSTPEGALEMFCAVEEGVVLSIGRGTDLIAHLDRELTAVSDLVGRSALILGCDCVLRRLEIERKDLRQAASEVLKRHRVFGFSTYGEQFNSLHVNQTLTGIAIGGEP